MGLLRQLERTVTAFDLLEHHRVLGVGAGGLGGLGQAALPLLDPVGDVPQPTLVDAGERQDVLLDARPGDEVVGLHAQLAPGAAAVQAGPLEHVEPVAVRELVGDVGRGLGVDDAVAGAGGAEDRVARPASDWISRWTPDRPRPSAPSSSVISPSRSRRPTPAITVMRWCRSRLKVSSPASITSRSKYTPGASAQKTQNLSHMAYSLCPRSQARCGRASPIWRTSVVLLRSAPHAGAPHFSPCRRRLTPCCQCQACGARGAAPPTGLDGRSPLERACEREHRESLLPPTAMPSRTRTRPGARAARRFQVGSRWPSVA